MGNKNVARFYNVDNMQSFSQSPPPKNRKNRGKNRKNIMKYRSTQDIQNAPYDRYASDIGGQSVNKKPSEEVFGQLPFFTPAK